ncbi:MAG TPA: hypothetical protein VKY73_02040, partial [Polyangiaceae bacterium]|nr:hypothetical protein [Polyangiaceae bacterium]
MTIAGDALRPQDLGPPEPPDPERTADAEELGAPETPFQQARRSFRRDRLAMGGLVVLVALAVLALVGKALTE